MTNSRQIPEQRNAGALDRRDFLYFATAGAMAFSLPVVGRAVTGAPRISGRVVLPDGEDAAGIIVTNGRDCVLTAADGSYSLPVYDGLRFVSVTVPSGYRATWSHAAYPRRWGSYDFRLEKWAPSAGAGSSFVHIADSEIDEVNADEKLWADNVRRLAERENAAFIVHTGDICRRRGLLAHHQLMNADTMGRPVFYCLGNHDLEVGPYGESLFESLYGPSWYSFEAGGTHFVVTPMPEGDYPPGFTTDQVADWIRNDLACVKKGTPVVFFGHMISNWKGPREDVGFTYGDTRKIRLDSLCNQTGYVYGHVHFNLFRRVGEGGKTAFVCTSTPNMGGIGHSPVSTRILRVDAKGRLTSRLVYGLVEMPRGESAGALWETRVKASVLFGRPVAVGGKVLVGVSDEDGEGTGAVVALEATTGRKVWTAPVDGSVVNGMVHVGGLVIAQDTRGRVSAFRLSDGGLAWHHAGFGHPWRATYSGLATDGRLVFAGTPLRLMALDASDGHVVWQDRLGTDAELGEASADTPAVTDGVLVFASNWRGLHGYEAATGRRLWIRKDEDFFRFPGCTPQIADGKVRWLGGRTFCELDLRTGETLRMVDTGCNLAVTTRVLERRADFVFGTADSGLVVLDKKTFKLKKTFLPEPALVAFAPYTRTPQLCVGTVPVGIGEDEVAATATDGSLHIWNLSSGRERCFRTGSPYLAGVTVSGRTAFVADISGCVRAFDLACGKGK